MRTLIQTAWQPLAVYHQPYNPATRRARVSSSRSAALAEPRRAFGHGGVGENDRDLLGRWFISRRPDRAFRRRHSDSDEERIEKDAAADWGELVKAAVDVYRGDLLRKLGYVLPPSRSGERELWQAHDQLFTYRNTSRLENFDHLRLPPPADPGACCAVTGTQNGEGSAA